MLEQNRSLLALLEPVVTALGYEVLGIECRQQKNGLVLRLYIDSASGIVFEDCVRVSRQISGVLDVHDSIKEKYDLEVSSPGLDRPLFTLSQFEKFLGQKVTVKLTRKVNKRRKITGVIREVGDSFVLVNEAGKDYVIPADFIESARIVPNFCINH